MKRRLLNQLSSVCHLLIGNYQFARDYGCVHSGMPSGRKHPRRNRDAPKALERPKLTLVSQTGEVKHQLDDE